MISPKEQTEVMGRIFGSDSSYSQASIEELKQVMALEGQRDPAIYGKTGMGKEHGVMADAWYTGLAEQGDRVLYFCVYLGETDRADVSGATAREIAVQIFKSY